MASLSEHSGLQISSVEACSDLRHVHHATFEQLSLAGYDIRTFDDGAVPLKPEKDNRLSGICEFPKSDHCTENR